MSHPIPPSRLAARVGMPIWLRLFSVLVFFSALPQRAWADFGIFQDYAVLNANGGGYVYYAGGANADNSPKAFQNHSFGAFTAGQTLVLGSEIKTYKNNGTNVTGARLYYRVYLTGTTAGAFIQTNPAFSDNLSSGGDQKWTNVANSQSQNTPAPVDLLAGLAPGYYTLEVNWTAQADNAPDVADNNIGANYKATFSYDVTPMPVTLTAFSAQRQGSETVLSWTTANETNNAGYEAQVSTDGQAFRTLGMVAPAAATSSTAHSYTFLDREEGKTGLRHYRLRQVDLDGTFAYSPVRTVQFGTLVAVQLTATPNPFSDNLTLLLGLPQASTGPATLQLTDALGRLVLHQDLGVLSAGLSQATLSEAGKLPAGIYLARLVLPTSTQVLRVVKE